MSNVRLQEFVDDHPVDISHMLQKLCETGFLISDNKKRWSTYHIANQSTGLPLFNQLNDNPKSSSAPGSIYNGEKPSSSAPGSIYNDEKPSSSSTSSIHNDEKPLPSPNDSIHSAISSNESDEGEALQRIIAPIVGKERVKPELMRQVILKLCGNRFLTIETMAKLTNRNSTALRNQYISPMVEEGLLTLKYPETPTRPDQAYTTVEKTL